MFKALITEFPLSDVPKERTVTEEKIRKYTYTKDEVDVLISDAVKEAVNEARKIDEASMAKHNRDATVLSMILGFTTLALFVDGLLRVLGIVPLVIIGRTDLKSCDSTSNCSPPVAHFFTTCESGK